MTAKCADVSTATDADISLSNHNVCMSLNFAALPGWMGECSTLHHPPTAHGESKLSCQLKGESCDTHPQATPSFLSPVCEVRLPPF